MKIENSILYIEKEEVLSKKFGELAILVDVVALKSLAEKYSFINTV